MAANISEVLYQTTGSDHHGIISVNKLDVVITTMNYSTFPKFLSHTVTYSMLFVNWYPSGYRITCPCPWYMFLAQFCQTTVLRHHLTFFTVLLNAWWRHKMETFSVLMAFCAGNSVTGEFPSQSPVTRNFAVFFDLLFNTRISKQSRGCWFETPLCSLWRHCNGCEILKDTIICKSMLIWWQCAVYQ